MKNKLASSIPTRNKYLIISSSSLLLLLPLTLFVFVPKFFSYETTVPPQAVLIEPGALPKANVTLPPIYFTGDVMLGRYVETLLARDQIKPFDFMRLFSSSSAVVINFESAIALPHRQTPSGGMQFSTALASLAILDELSVTHASLANNHARDYGLSGYQNAFAELAARRITPFGDAARVATTSLTYIPYGEETIGIIGLHTLFVTPTAEALTPLFAELAASSTIQIAYVHWGNEYQLTHSPAQGEFAKLLVDLGTDIIIGHHPHVTQDIELIDDVPVFYSLGNFIFDQYFSPEVQEGLVLGFTLTPDSYEFALHPHYQCARSTPCLMGDEQRALSLDALAARSAEPLQSQIKAETLIIPR
jgi:gamma-polyglutamate biosynthesis protein CapA